MTYFLLSKMNKKYKESNKTGGPGKFGFNNNSFLDENSHLISNKNREKLLHEWSKYWDLSI